METRARHVLIGLFTLIAAALAVLFALWLGRSDRSRDFHLYDIAFEEAVSGLSRGSTVEFNGIRVGDVVDLRLDPDNPRNVFARVRVERDAPVRTDTQAMLMPVGITGTSLIRLSSGNAPTTQALVGDDQNIPIIHATPSPMSKLLAGGEDVLYNFNQLLVSANTLFSNENIQKLSQTLAHIEKTTQALANQRDGLGQAIANFNQAAVQAQSALAEMDKMMRSGKQTISVDFKQTLGRADKAFTSFEKSMGTLEATIQENRGSLQGGARGLSEAGPALTELRSTLSTLQDVLRQFDNRSGSTLINREPMKEFAP